MKITILQTGEVPQTLRDRFDTYPHMFRTMFAGTGEQFDFETVNVLQGEPFPDPTRLGGVVITGSSAGVYDDYAWMEPLRQFIREAYAARTPTAGICFGHQIIADALGGDVRKSEKGWGLGRHTYGVKSQRGPFAPAATTLAVACSHQDQVIVPPAEAEVILGSDFTPNAGLFYKNGAAISFQPHPEFEDDYARELVALRRGIASEETIAAAEASFETASNSADLARMLGRFFTSAQHP